MPNAWSFIVIRSAWPCPSATTAQHPAAWHTSVSSPLIRTGAAAWADGS